VRPALTWITLHGPIPRTGGDQASSRWALSAGSVPETEATSKTTGGGSRAGGERALPCLQAPEPLAEWREGGPPPGYVLGGAPLISPSAERGSRSTAKSPSDTMPTACPPSTTGRRRMAWVRMSRTASSTLSVGVTVTRL
jgi:hypothetical protein